MNDAQVLEYIDEIVAAAQHKGADAAEAVMVGAHSLSVSWRLGKCEDIDRSEARDLGIRVFFGRRSASVSLSDISKPAIALALERVVDMARAAPEDPYARLAEPALVYADHGLDLDLCDDQQPTAEALSALAAATEEAALAVPKISNSEGASAGWQQGFFALATSNGFRGLRRGSSYSLSASVVAAQNGGKERDYDYSAKRHFADLEAPQTVGRSAGERTVRRLGATKIATATLPIVFDKRVGASLLGHFAGAVNGQAIARGTSFLRDHMGKQIFAAGVKVIDDPLIRRGLASRPFDGEGVGCQRLELIRDGVLTSWLLDSATAAQLKLRSTGHAARGTGGPPSPSCSNLYLAAGDVSPAALIADIKTGLYVTELIGMGVNGVTGDYSRGAAGFLIENGVITRPVSEVTIAGNLLDMFARLIPADDLEMRYGVNMPTCRIDAMMVAGA